MVCESKTVLWKQLVWNSVNRPMSSHQKNKCYQQKPSSSSLTWLLPAIQPGSKLASRNIYDTERYFTCLCVRLWCFTSWQGLLKNRSSPTDFWQFTARCFHSLCLRQREMACGGDHTYCLSKDRQTHILLIIPWALQSFSPCIIFTIYNTVCFHL